MDSNGLAIHDNLIINVYEMGDYKKIKGIFKTIAQDILLTHYENVTIEGGKELSEGILSIVVDKLIGESKITDGIGAVHTVVSCVKEVGETMDTNRDIEDIQNLLTTADTYEALRLHASVSTSGNEYSIHLFYMETDELKTLIQEYNAWAVTVTGYEKMETDISVIAQAIQAGNLESVTGIEDYVKWFIWHYSEEKESEESEEIYVAN